ncbi:histone-lysine N-methyltransferase PRDM9-like isoform X2 [Clavelina lepadiformis]|uniref:histone-lysine N-methyltransferase PRDM9-like isoform X2 n=1 Tax=Clavelina lepadiformis TaxID=159417 RepID=UPI004042C139
MVFEADTFVRRNTEDRARRTCPPGIVIGSSHAFPGELGVWAQRDINEGTIFGSFEGDLVDTNDLRNLILAFQSGNAWEIYTDGKLSYCIDGSDEKKSNWLRYVKFASKEESNVVAYEQLGKVYHCTTQLIFGGEEFLVYPETKFYATHPKIWMQTSKILVEVKCTRTAPENILLCNKCEKVFFNVEAFNRHLPCNLQTQTDETSCPNPGRFMLSRSIAPNAPFLVSASGSMVFTNCDASNWPWRKYLYDERGSKTPPKSELPFCPDEPSSSSLNQEVSTESDKKPFVCKTCEKQFSLKKSFRLHKRTHIVQTHTCGHCNNEYPQLSQLKRHVRMVHHKRYICSVCGAKYGQSSDLKSHMTKHSDVRAHKCRYCGKGLKRADDLKRHERRHTEGRRS